MFYRDRHNANMWVPSRLVELAPTSGMSALWRYSRSVTHSESSSIFEATTRVMPPREESVRAVRRYRHQTRGTAPRTRRRRVRIVGLLTRQQRGELLPQRVGQPYWQGSHGPCR